MIKEEQQVNYIPSRYSKAFNSYSRNEIRWVVPILRSVARSCHIAFRYPVYKVLKAVAKIFLMNEVEAIFFAYMIRQTNWDIKDKLITQNSEQVRDIVCYANDHPEYKNLILYLMLVTYTLKFFLNEHIQELLEEAIRICPNFKLIFQNWAKKHSSLTKRINPKTLNKVYQDLHFKIRHQEPDFNLLVDSILQISPAYNPEKNEKDKKTEKKDSRDTQPREILPRQQPVKMVKTEAQANIQYTNPIFSSSRLYQMAGGVGVGLNISQGSNFQVFGLQKSGNIGTRFGNSVFGSSGFIGGVNLSIKDEEQQYCEQLNLGLQQGQSEQNINMREMVADYPPNSILNMSRNNSIADRYLNMKGEASDYHS